jgi:hypothetical protein
MPNPGPLRGQHIWGLASDLPSRKRLCPHTGRPDDQWATGPTVSYWYFLSSPYT